MKLNEYIDKYDANVSALARRCNVSSRTLWYLLNGKDCKLTIAAKIVAGTHGQVTYEDLIKGMLRSKSPK